MYIKYALRLILTAIILFFLIGLPVWVSMWIWGKVDGVTMAVIVPVWGFIVIAINDNLAKEIRKGGGK